MTAIVRTARRVRVLPMPLLLGAAILLAALGGLAASQYREQRTAIPFPVPVYQIEASSGGCTGSILNLGIGYVGTLEAPMPVDVNCDLLPDVLVAVNLIDIEGPVHDPLATDSTSYEDFLADRIGRTIAPNIEINRYPLNALSSILLRPSPPARINVKLTLKDLEFEEPDTIVRFGYDTGLGGSIPGQFKAVVRGLEDFFNPLEAVVDTKGDLQGGDTVPSYYEGPLTLIGGLSKSDGSFDAKLGINYKPFPDVVKVGYSSDEDGNHIDYAHGIGEQILRGYGTAMPDGTFEHYVPGELPEVDMKTTLDVLDQGDTLNLTAALDRLPRGLELDFNTPADGGRIDFASTTDGRLPDARVNLRSVSDGELTRAEAFVEELPPELHAQWSMLDDDLASALFTTSDPDAPDFDLDNLGAGPGIGAIEALFSNVDVPTEFVPFVPTQQQFVNMQTLGEEQLITARVEEIRGFKFDTRSDGFDIAARVGDGALPLEANVQVDGLPESGDSVDATATISPLPSSIDVNLFNGTKGDLNDPFKVVYKSSQGVDVDAHAELREADAADAACGEPGTTCADVGLRHLPAELTFAMGENGVIGQGATTDVAVDLVPRPGSPKPDVILDAILGKLDSVDDPEAVEEAGPVLLEAEGVLRGIPDTIRVHFVEGADKSLERLDFATCELTPAEKCPDGTDPIESVEVKVRNFRDAERADALVPHPASVAPQFATLTSRGFDDPEKTDEQTVRFEAAARINDITEVRYASVNGLFGVRSAVGDDSDLEVLLDLEDIIFDDDDPEAGPVDVKGRALISPLPSEIDLCLREAQMPLTLASPATFTDRCEVTDPFLDGSVTKSPMTLSYLANTDFKVDATVDMTEHGLLDAVTDDHTIHGAVVVDKVPKDLTAHIQTPPEKLPGAPAPTTPERLRVRTIAPGATNTNVDLAFEDRLGGATCEEPQPAGDITCATAKITQLPVYASVVADSGPGEDTHAKVYACDLDLSTTTCRAGTEGSIKELSARLRMVTGDPVEEGDLVPFVFDEHPYAGATPPSGAYHLALRMDQDDDKNKELRAEGRLEDLRSLSFDRTEEGFDVHTDLGNGVKPLLASIGIDTRVPAEPDPDADPPDPDADPPEPGKLIVADTRVLPLPAQITISQHGPGDDQKANPLAFTYDSSSPVQVDARAQIYDQVAGLLCGDHGTVCATLHLDRLPTHIAATIGTFDEAIPETAKTIDVRRRMFIDLDAIPFADVDNPDLVFDAVLGSTPPDEPPLDDEGNPIFDDTPIVAHGELRGFSEKARIRLAQSGDLQADKSLKDTKFEEALFVTCELIEGSSPPSCGTQDDNGDPVDYEEFPVEEFAVSARNFHSRPTDFPVPRRTDVPDRNLSDPPNSDAMYAEAVARGDDFEAHAGFTNVREFRMRNVDEILGVLVRGGDGQEFTAHGDVAGINLPEEDLTEDGDFFTTVVRSTLAANVDVKLSNVPTKFAFCMRQQGAPIKALTGDFTEPCENQHPFADAAGQPFFDAEEPLTAPMSIAYRANDPIEQITTNAVAQILRTKVITFLGTEFPSPLPSLNIKGDVTVDNLPERLTAHIETPTDKDDEENAEEEEPGGPIRALFFYDDAPSIVAGGDPVDITFDAEYTENDAVCRDIRDGQVAFCLSGKLENLPKRVKAYIDPEANLFLPAEGDNPPEMVQNLRIFANNDPGEKLNLRNLDISVVKDDDPAEAPLVLIAEGNILGLPELVMGTIHMPASEEEQAELPDDDPLKFDKPAFDIVATPPLDEVDVQVRNFVAPDVMPPVAPARDGATPDQSITFQQRGDFFKAVAKIKDVAGGGFRTGRNSLGQATETQLIRVDFGIPGPGDPKPQIRGYVDLLTDDDEGNPTHIFADILLDDMPHGVDVCFRGEYPPAEDIDHDLTAAPGTEVYCDTVPTNLGAFRFNGRTTGDPEPELDVDAIFRMTEGSDTNVLKAIATIENIPNTIEGQFGDGAVSVQTFKADGTTPTGIDDVRLEMADFDFEPDGYGIFPPWGARVPGTVTLPDKQPGPDHEFARVGVDASDFHVQAHLGTAFDGSPGARFTKFIMDPTACPMPAGSSSYYPHYPPANTDSDPETLENSYTCVRGELEDQSTHPLLLDANLVLDGKALSILNAGLASIPKSFQVTIAETEVTEAKDVNGTEVPDVFRRRCGSVDAEADDATDCMPPLLHYQSSHSSQLFGTLLLGEQADRDLLFGTQPKAAMVDLNEHAVPGTVRPGDDQWANEYPVAGGQGVRAKIASDLPGGRDAIQASFRLPIPRALTVDQIQDWSFKDDVTLREASDLRFHFVMRDENGVALGNIGDLALMIHNFKSQGQTLVGHHDDPQRGLPIPGEFGIDYFNRNHKAQGRELHQADLRTSSDLAARVRLIAGTGDTLGNSDFRLTGLKGATGSMGPEEPSFRLRAELKNPAIDPNAPPAEPEEDDWKDDLLCLVWCVGTEMGNPELTAEIDLDPDSGSPVRLLEAVVNTVADTKLGAEIRSYANIDGTGEANFAAEKGETGANPFATGGIHVDIDPFNIFVHAGVPILAGFDLLLLSEANVDLEIAPTDEFMLKMDTTKLTTKSAGADLDITDGLSNTWLQVSLDPALLAGFFSLFWPFPPVYLWYAIEASPVLPFFFYQCPTPVYAGLFPYTMPIATFERDVTAFLPFAGPFPVPPLLTFGTPIVKEVLDAVFGLAGPPIMCAIFDTGGIPLHSGDAPSHTGDRSPGDALVLAGHPVAGLGISSAPVSTPPTPVDPPDPNNLVIGSGQTVTLCGTHVFNDITIESGGTLNVATVADPVQDDAFVECPDNYPDDPGTAENEFVQNVGRLNLVGENVTINGTANGPGSTGTMTITGADFTLNGTVNVFDGHVELQASDDMTINGGIVDGFGNVSSQNPPVRSDNGVQWASASVSNAGASHRGVGGQGTGAGLAPSPGPAYGSGTTTDTDIDPGTERGYAGKPVGTTGGQGGGSVAIRGNHVEIGGTVDMGATGATSNNSGTCFVLDTDPGTAGNQTQFNTGVKPGGGGSGGGIAIHGVDINITGSLWVDGGAGGSGRGGAGGGGGGGLIRLNAGDVDYVEANVHLNGGAGGTSGCPADFGHGGAGGDGAIEVTETPQSIVTSTGQFWYQENNVDVPYRAAAAEIPNGSFGGFFDGIFDNRDFNVYLCGIHRGPEALEEGGDFGLVMPTGPPDAFHPCGTAANDDEISPTLLRTVHHTDTEVFEGTISPSSDLAAGVWGLWTVASKPDTSFFGDCFPFFPFFEACALEINPTAAEMTIAVDDVDPAIALAPVGTTAATDGAAVTQSADISIALSQALDTLPKESEAGSVNASGIGRYFCYVDDGGGLAGVACHANSESIALTLPGGEGRYDVYIVAEDNAFNYSAPFSGDVPDAARFDDDTADPFDDDRLTFVLDQTPPAVGTAAVTNPGGGPNGENGWYDTVPTEYTISGYDDGAAGSGEPAAGGFEYRFDGGEWARCLNPCVLADPIPLPQAGTHTLNWKAHDAAGFVTAVQTLEINIDTTAPETAVTSIPGFVAGEWITAAHPVVVARGEDEFGGSEVDQTFMSTTGIGGPYTPYTGPRELFSGENQVVCAYSVDVAGNTESVTACTQPLDIDNQDPTGNVTIVPPAPTGNDPWYDGDAPVPTVTFSGYDGTGSPAPAGGGFRYRVDNSTEFSCADGCVVDPGLLGEGSNVLHWTVVDSAGNRAPERRVELNVDIDDPRSYLLLDKPKADGANGWHVTKPWVTLVGFDEPKGTLDLRPVGSGVDRVEYTIDAAGPFTYSEPFAIAPGDHDVCIQASDVAGNDEGGRVPHCHRIAYDPADPSTSILENGLVTPAPDGDNGWYKLSAVNVTQTSTDGPVPPASGLTPQSLGSTLCDHDRGTDPAPAGVCISIDGRAPGATIAGPEFGPYTGAILLGEGDHRIRAFSVDNAGRRSEMDHNVVHIDRSDPVSIGRLRAPQASRVGLQRPWWRHQPTLVLRAIDGDQNAGIRRIEYRLNGGAVETYAAPVTMPVGIKYVEHRAIDESGRTSAWKRMDVAVDVTPPVVKATFASPSPLWLHINLLGIIKLGPEKSKLQYEVTEELSGKVKIRVIVYAVTGQAVRHLDGGTIDVTPGVKKTGHVLWDGKDDGLIGFLPAGVYYYRVVATDDAGNVAMSGESLGLQVKVKLVLLL